MSDLAINMNYDFRQSKFDNIFQPDLTQKVKQLIEEKENLCIISMQGLGASVYFKYLTTREFAESIYVDFHLLPSVNLLSSLNLILRALGNETDCQTKEEFINRIQLLLKPLTDKGTVVFYLNHFNHLVPTLGSELFDLLRSLRSTFHGKVVYMIHLNRPILDQIKEKQLGFNMNLFSRNEYLKPYSESDLKQIAPILMYSDIDNPKTQQAIELSGGHYLLFQLLLKTEYDQNPLQDSFIKLHLKEILNSLSYRQQKQIEKIATDKLVTEVDRLLLALGIVTLNNGKYQLFTPLLYQYLKSNLSLKLSLTEKKLFSLLKKRLGKVVNKDEIFETVWANRDASDWALNSAIYRIRQNPIFQQQGYSIESYKKTGYLLRKD